MKYRGRALPIYEELDDQVGLADELTNMGNSPRQDGHFDEALDLYPSALFVLGSEPEMSWGKAGTSNNLAEVLLDQGRFDEACPMLEEALTRDPPFRRNTLAPPSSLMNLAVLGRRAVRILTQATGSTKRFRSAEGRARRRTRERSCASASSRALVIAGRKRRRARRVRRRARVH